MNSFVGAWRKRGPRRGADAESVEILLAPDAQREL